MKFYPTQLAGVVIVEIEPFCDERGFFATAFTKEAFEANGLSAQFVQSNISYNQTQGTVRGLHFQTPPHAQSKLLRCTRGAVFDVAVDFDPASPTFRQWVGVELSADNHRMLYVSGQYAHGFQTLEAHSEVFYEVSHGYAPQYEDGLRWDDPAFAIDWPLAEKRIISAKDQAWPLFETRSL